MSIHAVTAIAFSPTGTTKSVVSRIAAAASAALGEDRAPADHDITLPSARRAGASFRQGDLVVVGVPVYAGRVPTLLVDYLRTVRGGGAFAVAVVVYGNRHYDDALIELADLLEAQGFVVVAAAAFIGEHSYSRLVAPGRPDAADLALATELAVRVTRKLSGGGPFARVVPTGTRPYRELALKIDLGNARPVASAACQRCRACVEVCPLGAIDPDELSTVGDCLRCNACVKGCPAGARSFSDASYRTVRRWLEGHCAERRTPELFLG
jgi:ferredoxin